MLGIFGNIIAGGIAMLVTLGIAVVLIIHRIAKSVVEHRASPAPRTLASPPPHPMLGVSLGLAPTFFMLLLRMMAGVEPTGTFLTFLLVVCFLLSAGCCFGSGFILFQRRTALAIVAGVLFVLLNAAFSFWFGCAAVLSKAGI